MSNVVISSVFAGRAEFIWDIQPCGCGLAYLRDQEESYHARVCRQFSSVSHYAEQETQSRSIARQHVAGADMHAWNDATHGDGL
jgi:hypothetical protein